MQVSYEIRGMATTVEAAVAAGELELNVMEPVIARHVLAGLHDVGRVAQLFATRCVTGLRWNDGPVARNLAGSRAHAVEVSVERGYAHAVDSVNRVDSYGGASRQDR
jgi:aspartate ammonia-lyase